MEDALKAEITELVTTAIKASNGELIKGLPTIISTTMKGVTDQVTGFGDTLKGLNDTLAALKPAGTPPPPDKKVDPAPAGASMLPPEVAAQLTKLNTDLKKTQDDLKLERDARQATELSAKQTRKESMVRAALNQFQYASPEAAEDAFSLISNSAEWAEDGRLVVKGGDGQPLLVEDFVKTHIPEKKPYLLATIDKGGSGANAGRLKNNGPAIGMDDIKVGMSPEQTSAAVGAILAAIPRH